MNRCGEGKNSEINRTKLEAARDFQAEIVITEHRVLDWLLQQPGVDPKRIAYIGHSYGGIAGDDLAGVEPRIAAFVLSGAVPSFAKHMEVNESPYWQDARNYLPDAHAPVLVQCARFDTDDNVKGCPDMHSFAGGPKRLACYDDDHNFTSLEAMRDRMSWLEKYLKLKPTKLR